MPLPFYNTIELEGVVLEIAEIKGLAQEEKVLLFLERNHPRKWTAYEIRDAIMATSPRSSTIRALCNLRDRGKVEKTEYKKIERYGKPNFLWALKMGQMNLNF